jgi:glycosyltransferase involved in cell wall biosynthesis
MIQDVTRLLEDNNLRERMGENARQYFISNHDIEKVTKDYIKVFANLGLEI